jgi:hypothetical protein
MAARRLRSWVIQRRRQRQIDPVPMIQAPERAPDGAALYLGTTVGGSQQHHLVAGALFGRGACRYWLEPGRLVLQREGGGGPEAPGDVVVALTGILQVGLSGAHAGQVLAPSRIAVVTWALDNEEVDTGFGFADAKRAERFADQVTEAAGLSPDRGPHASA